MVFGVKLSNDVRQMTDLGCHGNEI